MATKITDIPGVVIYPTASASAEPRGEQIFFNIEQDILDNWDAIRDPPLPARLGLRVRMISAPIVTGYRPQDGDGERNHHAERLIRNVDPYSSEFGDLEFGPSDELFGRWFVFREDYLPLSRFTIEFLLKQIDTSVSTTTLEMEKLSADKPPEAPVSEEMEIWKRQCLLEFTAHSFAIWHIQFLAQKRIAFAEAGDTEMAEQLEVVEREDKEAFDYHRAPYTLGNVHCANCACKMGGKNVPSPVQCEGCKRIFYCSTACRDHKATREEHMLVCKPRPEARTTEPPCDDKESKTE